VTVGGIRITSTHMSSPDTPHTATATADGWEVSWLPGRTLDRNQATTAMVIAHTAGSRAADLAQNPIWPFLETWAAELGLSGPDAVARASQQPGAHEPATSQEPEAGA